MEQVQNRTEEDIPERLQGHDRAKAFYGIAAEAFKEFDRPDFNSREVSADLGLQINDIIEKKGAIVDWYQKQDIQNEILNQIEDCLVEVKKKFNLELGWDEIDKIMHEALDVAKYRAVH